MKKKTEKKFSLHLSTHFCNCNGGIWQFMKSCWNFSRDIVNVALCSIFRACFPLDLRTILYPGPRPASSLTFLRDVNSVTRNKICLLALLKQCNRRAHKRRSCGHSAAFTWREAVVVNLRMQRWTHILK